MADKEEGNKDFKTGLKTTSLFGGVQVFKILISIVNAKIVAILLGPVGVGTMGLLSSTTSLITQATNLGLGSSAVRDVATAYSSGEMERFNRTVSIFRRLVWVTGLLGLLVCALFSPLWSRFAFGDSSYTWSFIVLSFTILLSQVSSGQSVVLQGTRNFRSIAKAGIYGSIIGLIVGIPFYYLWGEDGIVPVMVIGSVSGVLLTYYFSRKVKTHSVNISWREVVSEGSIMMKMGLLISLQGLLNLLCAYVVRIYVGHIGSMADVGLYNSGFNIINTYVGMVFTAMGTEYYPRLASYSNDVDKFTNAINQQMVLAILIVGPLIAGFLVFSSIAIDILYSTEFLGATSMVMYGILGVFFKVPGWCLGFSFIAKGDSIVFFINEFCYETFSLILNVLFYHWYGLNGLGLSFLVGYIVYAIQCYFVCHIRYRYIIYKDLIIVFIPQILLGIIVFVITYNTNGIDKYLWGIPFCLISLYLSCKNINTKINIRRAIKSRIFKHY